MRYDDMIDTVLRADPASENQQATAWSQLSDLLAQKGDEISSELVSAALTRLSELKRRVPLAHRTATARAIARRCHFVPLVAFYGGDSAPVAHALLSEVQLSDEAWLTLIPLTTPLARTILRERRDLGIDVERALQAFGAIDFRLGADAAALAGIAPAAETADANQVPPHGTQISELVRRIEAYRAGRQQQPVSTEPVDTPFRFETGADGVICWTDNSYRGAIIGISIAEPAFDGESGTDAYSAGAFRQRSPIASARMQLEGDARLGGEWRFSATPLFDTATGQFLGYKGSARRPRPGETANPVPFDKVLGSASFGESMRQLIHELRTPLNAISGFAQMIDNQMFGPVPQRYRAMADEIIGDSNRLMTIFSDLDLAARLDSDTLVIEEGSIAVERVIETLAAELDRVSDQRQVRLRIELADGLPMLDADPAQARRLIGRLLSALIEVGAPGETIAGNAARAPGMIRFSVGRPASLRGLSEPLLLDPGFSPEGDAPDAAMLSLGFSLRLVINLARSLGGRLDIGNEAFTLYLPAAQQDERGSGAH